MTAWARARIAVAVDFTNPVMLRKVSLDSPRASIACAKATASVAYAIVARK